MRDPEPILRRFLIVMLVAATTLVLTGGIWMLVEEGTSEVTFQSFSPADAELLHPANILAAALDGRPAGIVQLGIVLLLFTPLLRELTLTGIMAQRREWLYVGVGAVVVALLAFGILVRGMT